MYCVLFALLLVIVPVSNASEPGSVDQVADNQKEWVVVLNDPRPARARGWLSNNYQDSASYQNSLELKRFGRRVARKHGLVLKDQWLIESMGLYCLIVNFKDNSEQALQALLSDKRVEWVQESNEFKLLASEEGGNAEAMHSFTASSSLSKIPADVDGSGVVIAIIDSGVDSDHPDLAPAIKLNTDFVAANGAAVTAAEVHGTAIAGVIVARQNEELGISGVAPGADLLALRGCWEQQGGVTRCSTLSLARALNAVILNQPDILNLSLSGPSDRLLSALLRRVVSDGTRVMAAFDPARSNHERFPSSNDGAQIVRADRLNQEVADVFTAPGAQLVTSPGSGYNFMKGHSVATAYASGVLALQKQAEQTTPTMPLASAGR